MGKKGQADYTELEQLPNVGPATAAYFRRIGISRPADLEGRDPYVLFDDLCRVTGQRIDPCMLDVLISVVRFMDGDVAQPWWKYTAERKRTMAARNSDPTTGRGKQRSGN